jgi:hypothetical protein
VTEPRTCPHCGRRYWSAGAHMEECSGNLTGAPWHKDKADEDAERVWEASWKPEWERGSE